jgi:hypothetical protein
MHSSIKAPLRVKIQLQAAITIVVLACLLGQRISKAASSSVQTPPARESVSDDSLLKPPPIDDPRQALIRNAVRTAFPELFGRSAPPGWVGVTLILNPDGTLYRSYKGEAQPRAYYPNNLKAFDAMAVDYEYRGDRVQLAMTAGSNGATKVSVRAYYLKPILDKTRDFARVRAIVNAHYRALYKPTTADRVTELTVFMTASGGIERAQARTLKAIDADVAPTTANFGALRIPRERVGPVNEVMLYEGAYEGSYKSLRLLLIYAWPRRPGEPAPGPWHPWQNGPMEPNDNLAVDRAISEKYFPDLYTFSKPEYEADADFWVLLDHTGHVRATGRRYMASAADLKVYLQSLYPGIRTEGFEGTDFRGDHYREAVVNYTWLASDSPVSDLSQADASKRGDIALYAGITGDGMTNWTNLVAFKFGSSAIAVDDRRDLYLEVAGSEAGADAVALRARIQHLPRSSPTGPPIEMPNTLENNWPSETPPIRVRYGGFAVVQLTDQEHKTWHVTLYPDHLRGAIH